MNFTINSQVWDLHIHTNLCPKGSNEFAKDFGTNTKGFIDKLLEKLIFEGQKKVDMISFTDHNQISLDVYNEFYSRETNIKLIPGIEIDCIIGDDEDIKHILFYFECDKEDINNYAIKVNHILEQTRELGEAIEISKLFERLIKIGCNFIVSPHAFKQDKRSINHNWNNEEYTEKAAPMYMDQFFVFWEASGYSTIQKAKEFLESFKLDNKISIISFSDSDNFAKLETYLSTPPQYFHSLPTFRGLAMVGTDATRIRSKVTPFDSNKNPGMIKEVIFDGITIQFSTQLNAIIGGRGSGKSVLLDSIAAKLENTELPRKRKEFLKKFPISIKNYNNSEITTAFSIDYFNQAYVSDLFSENNFGENLKKKFKESFSNLVNIKKEDIELENKKNFKELILDYDVQSVENLNAFSKDYPIISNDGLNLKVYQRDKIKIDKTTQVIDYNKELLRIKNYFDGLPQQLKENKNLKRLEDLLKLGIVEEIHKFNEESLQNNYSINTFIDKFFEAKKNKTEVASRKSLVEESIKSKIKLLSYETKYRNMIINAYFEIAENFQIYHSEYSIEDGSEKNRFIFSNELTIESPFDHLISVMNKYIDSRKYVVNSGNLVRSCVLFINGEMQNYLKESLDYDDLKNELVDFNLEYLHVNNIYYVEENKILNIMDQSPGTQTNILMEYIVYRRTSKPLLIDQPEDNIDNKTIYDKLRKWFTKLKSERQVIVVTHDANIVVNADAENVIIAEQTSDDKFMYHFGALEFEDIIYDASSILDGGKEAVKRRLTKYES